MSIARKLIPSDSATVFPFVFRITTTAANTVFTCPLSDYSGLTPVLNINWGDGNTSPLITASNSVNRIHTYVSPGTYTISISGFMPGFTVNNNSGIRNLITELVQWGIVGLRSVNFYGCVNLTVIPGSDDLDLVGGYTGLNEVISFAQEFGAQLIYVGKPISLNENVTSSTLLAEEFANRLAMQWEQPVRLLDERLTTVSATNTLQVNGKNSKEGRSIIDQVAAVILLDHALAIEKSLGDFAGQVVKSPEDK
jgi:putative Holliday junction resolvase